MRLLRGGAIFVCGVIGLAAAGHARDAATGLGIPPYSRAPSSVLSRHPYHPEFCSVFRRGPCFPDNLPPLGQDLRLTIVSTDQDRSGGAQDGARKPEDGDAAAVDKPLDSIGAIYAALRTCWVPPPRDAARHGMEYTVRFAFKRDGAIIAPPRVTYATHGVPADVRDNYRDAVNAALSRCTPLNFSDGMGGAVAGRPIAIRFVDERTIDKTKSVQ